MGIHSEADCSFDSGANPEFSEFPFSASQMFPRFTINFFLSKNIFTFHFLKKDFSKFLFLIFVFNFSNKIHETMMLSPTGHDERDGQAVEGLHPCLHCPDLGHRP